METSFKVDEAVELFVHLRDTIRKMEDVHKEKMKPFKDRLDQIAGLLQAHLDSTGADSVRTKYGTCSASVKYSTSLSDPEAFMAFVIDGQQWNLLDRKANLTAVKDYVNSHNGNLPPGCNLTSIKTVGVRRASNGSGD